MQNKEVKVSVIMPAYNADSYIGEAIKSVLSQEGEDLELLIIDDCSKDQTAKIVEEYSDNSKVPIRFLQNEQNRGVAESRNIGIRQAKGKYIAFLDADDWWMPGKVKEQIELMERSNLVLCYTGRELMNPDGSSTGRIVSVPERVTYKELLKTNSIPCSSAIVRTEVAREFYMEHDELHEDYIFWLQILKKYKEASGINKPMLKSRLSEKGKSRNKLKSAKMQWGVYRLMGIGRCKAMIYFLNYIWNGFRKYYG